MQQDVAETNHDYLVNWPMHHASKEVERIQCVHLNWHDAVESIRHYLVYWHQGHDASFTKKNLKETLKKP